MTPSETPEKPPSPSLEEWIARRKKIARISVGALVLLVVLLAVFFSAAFFSLNVETPGSQTPWKAVVQQGWTMKFDTKIIVFSSEAHFDIMAQGFETHRVVLNRSDPLRSVNVVLQPLPGIVHFTIEAVGNWTFAIDGKPHEPLPKVSVGLAPGPHTVEISGDAILPLQEEIEVTGRGIEQEAFLRPKVYRALLALNIDPPDAQVMLNGQRPGELDGRYVIPYGRSELTVSREGFHSKSLNVEASTDNEVIDLGTIKLKPLPAVLSLSSEPSKAAVLVGGKFVGETSVKLNLKAGTVHEIQLKKPGFRPASFSVNLKPGSSNKRHVLFNAELIEVSIRANLEAIAQVNGVSQGSTPITVSVTENDQVGVFREGFYAPPVEVSRSGGLKQSLSFKLIEEDRVAYEMAPSLVEVMGKIRLQKFPPLRYSIPVLVSDQANAVENIQIQITRPFYLSTHEVSAADFLAMRVPGERSKLQPSNHPAVGVTWSEATRFCNLLSDREGLKRVYKFDAEGRLIGVDTHANGYRLPTEAEWDAAIGRGLNAENLPMLYLWGNSKTIPMAYENFAGRESKETLDDWLEAHVDNHVGIAPIGSYPARENGMYDLAGNAAEWVHDYYESQYSKAGQTLVDPLGPALGSDHVVKGGSFRSHTLEELRFHYRVIGKYRSDEVGFRVARWIQ